MTFLKRILTNSLLLCVCSICVNAHSVVLEVRRSPQTVFSVGKGWVSYGFPEGKEEYELARASVGYMRFDWATINPEPGVYNWAPIDKFIAEWSRLGKQAAFGVMAANSHAGSGRFVAPPWLEGKGVEFEKKRLDNEGDPMRGMNGIFVHPSNYNSEVFLGYLNEFVKEFAKKYDGDKRIAFIDIRSYENWGEGFSPNHLLIYKKHFERTWLIQSSQEVRDSAWIVDQGVGLRRDGIGGSRGEELAAARYKVPAVAEFWGNLSYLNRRAWWRDGQLIDDLIRVGAPTYVQLSTTDNRVPDEFRKVVDKYTERIGFNFRLLEVNISDDWSVSSNISIGTKWINSGSEPIFYPAKLVFALIDNSGVIRQRWVSGSDIRKILVPGNRVSADVVGQKLEVEPGRYRLALGLTLNADDDKPAYSIDADLPIVNGWSVLQEVSISHK